MPHTNTALILAAGNGKRLAARSGELPKPLVSLNGRPLLEHVMRGAHAAGIDRFVIVLGYRGHLIQQWYESRPLKNVEVTWVENPEYHKSNGISALQGKKAINGRFLLMMADHIFDPETPRALLAQPLGDDEAMLAVDRNVDRVFDLDDATKVRTRGERIISIGKELQRYDALDTGMFLCTSALFQALERATFNWDCSLTEGVRLLAREGRFKAFDIGDAHWQDVDTPEALEWAQLRFARQPYSPHKVSEPAYV